MVNCFLSWRFYNCLQVWNSTLFFLRNFFAKKFITFWSVLYLKILLKSLRSRQKRYRRSFPNPAGYHFHGCFCFIPNWYDCGLSDYIFDNNVEKNGGMIMSGLGAIEKVFDRSHLAFLDRSCSWTEMSCGMSLRALLCGQDWSEDLKLLVYICLSWLSCMTCRTLILVWVKGFFHCLFVYEQILVHISCRGRVAKMFAARVAR